MNDFSSTYTYIAYIQRVPILFIHAVLPVCRCPPACLSARGNLCRSHVTVNGDAATAAGQTETRPFPVRRTSRLTVDEFPCKSARQVFPGQGASLSFYIFSSSLLYRPFIKSPGLLLYILSMNVRFRQYADTYPQETDIYFTANLILLHRRSNVGSSAGGYTLSGEACILRFLCRRMTNRRHLFSFIKERNIPPFDGRYGLFPCKGNGLRPVPQTRLCRGCLPEIFLCTPFKAYFRRQVCRTVLRPFVGQRNNPATGRKKGRRQGNVSSMSNMKI